jgi:hypothetical protein
LEKLSNSCSVTHLINGVKQNPRSWEVYCQGIFEDKIARPRNSKWREVDRRIDHLMK